MLNFVTGLRRTWAIGNMTRFNNIYTICPQQFHKKTVNDKIKRMDIYEVDTLALLGRLLHLIQQRGN